MLATLATAGAIGCRRDQDEPRPRSQVDPQVFVKHYADLAAAGYEDSAAAARRLSGAVDAFLAAPSTAGLAAARSAWLEARRPYVQTEAFRFCDGPIDRLEMLINAWPIDENYIDYVADAPASGIVNSVGAYPSLSADLLTSLNEREGEKNISTGFHAIEFLLWGQDQSRDSPGRRPHTDYIDPSPGAGRRGRYLRLAIDLLTRHLQEVSDAWKPGRPDNYRAAFLALPAPEAVRLIVKGLGQLSGPELTGERLTVAYQTKDQENEHSCFSDNTHNDVVGDILGIENICLGRYQRADGRAMAGPGLGALVAAVDQPLARALLRDVTASLAAARAIPPPFDQAILGRDDAPGRQAIRRTLDALEQQTATLARVAATFGVRLSNSSSSGVRR